MNATISRETRCAGSLHRLVRPFLLYHWSPVERRPQILKRGLRPHVASRCGQWKPPYVCFSDSPSLAWILSAGMTDVPGEWDLWMVLSNVPSKLTRRTDLENGRGRPTEFRAHEPIPKSKLWHVGVRAHRPNKQLVKQGRKIDLSKAAFQKLSSLQKGIIPVKIRRIR